MTESLTLLPDKRKKGGNQSKTLDHWHYLDTHASASSALSSVRSSSPSTITSLRATWGEKNTNVLENVLMYRQSYT